MQTVELKELQAHLVEKLDGAAQGEPFIVARDGSPWVSVAGVPLSGKVPETLTLLEQAAMSRFDESVLAFRTGFMVGQGEVPEDFDTMGNDEIEEMLWKG